MDVCAIADPRAFPDAAHAPPADAALYGLAARSLGVGTARESDPVHAQLRDALAARLLADGDALAALLSGAPSVDVARVLWRALDLAWRDVVAIDGGLAVTIFALPVVVVVAASGISAGTLPGSIADTARLTTLLREHRALRGNDTIALASALVAPDVLDVAALSRLLPWHRIDARVGAMRALAPAPLAYGEGRESVHARLAVGSAVAAPGVDLLAHEPAPGWAIPFTRELVRELAMPAVTVLALPGAPARPLQAVRHARVAQREVAAQLYASNALRRIRSRTGEPVAVISAHRADDAPGGGELRVSLSSPFEPRDAEGFRCPLYPLDRAADVARMLMGLLADCKVADVRVLAGVHADRVAGSLQPLLFKPDTIPPDAATLH